MDKLKVCYTIRDNLGDSINPLIFNKVFGVSIERKNEFLCDISGIGSGLRRFFVVPKSLRQKINMLKGKFCFKKLIIFSAGFLSTPTGNEKLLRKNICFCSVRGELSRRYISKIMKKEIECSTGDAGLLADRLIDYKSVEKKYDVGIIPHDKERGELFYVELQKKIPNSIIIDVRGDVISRLEEIASCKTIVTSSLHGLIISDSFHIPNLHVKLTNKLSGDGFKFKDYYSCYGLEDICINLNYFSNITREYIENNYKIDYDLIENKKNEIVNSFNSIFDKHKK